jgi:hypothetical protein
MEPVEHAYRSFLSIDHLSRSKRLSRMETSASVLGFATLRTTTQLRGTDSFAALLFLLPFSLRPRHSWYLLATDRIAALYRKTQGGNRVSIASL